MIETKQQVFDSAIKLLNILACTPSEENQAVILTARYEAASDETSDQETCPHCHDDGDVLRAIFMSTRGGFGGTPFKYCPYCARKMEEKN